MTTRLSLVMPVYNAAHFLPRVLAPLLAARSRKELHEIILVDDSSTDQSVRVAEEQGVRVVPSRGRLGPGGCRNVGAGEATGDALLFVDSDVIAHADVPRKVAAVFDAHPECVALFGSYDDEPEAPGLVSRYRNLLHHWTHQQGRADASTFWAGCGAVRRADYLEVGGFDAHRYQRPSIEDIELGHRLLARGRIRLEKDIQGKHLKRWTFVEMVRTDVWKRALPWSRLILTSDASDQDLNVNPAERAKAVVAGLFWLLWVLAPFLAAARWPALLLTLVAVLVNGRFFGLVAHKFGLVQAAAAVVLQQVYYLYSTLAWLWCLLELRVLGRGKATGGAA